MKEEMMHIAFDKAEKNLLLLALNDMKTKQLQEGRPTDTVDELILKAAYATKRKVKVVNDCERCHEDR